MNIKDILIFLIVFALVGFKLYQKYQKKNQSGSDQKGVSGSVISSSADDDYEPYLKK